MAGHGGTNDDDDLTKALERIKSQSKGNMSAYHQDLLKWTKNVDKRYAWVVLAALWLMMAATLGPYRLYGLIYAKVTTDGVYTREEASWPVSAIFTVENVVGPFVSIIAYHISYRQSMLIGGLLLVLGNGLASISQRLVFDVLLLGVVQGIGYAFIFMPFMEIINSYFLKYRNMALGMALCGGTLSIFALSPLFQWLLAAYPWRYSYFGIGLVCCINLLMVPLLRPNPKPTLLAGPRIPGQQTETKKRNRLSQISFRALTYQNSIRRQSTILITRRANPQGVAGGGAANSLENKRRQASIISVNPFASSVGLERKISRTLSVRSHQSNAQILTKQQGLNISQLSSAAAADHLESISLSEVGKEIDSDFDSSIVWEVLKTPAFHMIWYNELVYFWVFSIYCLVMVDFGVDRGLTTDEAESLLNYQSTGELLGRLVLTILVDMRLISNKNVVILVLFLLAGLLVLVTQITGILWLATSTVAISSLLSLLYILLNGLLVDYLGERQVTLGYGMASCIGGVLMSFRPQAVGYFRDNLGSYDKLMLCLAGACAFGALLWIVEPLITRFAKRKEADQANDTARG